jgi:hypothetical protein
MSKENNLTDFLTDVADAIREKKGTSEKINPQDFSEEIRGIEAGSPFAVDFGEEIATGNPTFIGALQEDIDYYNEVVNNVKNGLATELDYVADKTENLTEKAKEFKRKIAFWPKGFRYSQMINCPYSNLKIISSTQQVKNGYYLFQKNGSLQECEFDFSGLASGQWMFENCASLRRIDLQNAPITNSAKMFYGCYNLKEIKGLNLSEVINAESMFYHCFSLTGKLECDLPKCTNIGNLIEGCYQLDEIVINLPILTTNLQYSFRGLMFLKKATIHLPNIGKNTYFLYGSDNVEELYFSGMRYDTDLKVKKKLTLPSIKYICDNCLTRDDGASYTLTLHADVLTRFMAKCTEGNEEYDAEYAASLASANEKGLTLA